MMPLEVVEAYLAQKTQPPPIVQTVSVEALVHVLLSHWDMAYPLADGDFVLVTYRDTVLLHYKNFEYQHEGFPIAELSDPEAFQKISGWLARFGVDAH